MTVQENINYEWENYKFFSKAECLNDRSQFLLEKHMRAKNRCVFSLEEKQSSAAKEKLHWHMQIAMTLGLFPVAIHSMWLSSSEINTMWYVRPKKGPSQVINGLFAPMSSQITLKKK